MPMQLIVTRLREAIDGQTMYITVADYDRLVLGGGGCLASEGYEGNRITFHNLSTSL